MSVDVQEQFSPVSDIVLRYESPFAWHKEPYTDEFADWKARYADSVRLLMSALCNHPGVDLIHFTPSPVYCDPDAAIPQWNLLREVYAEL